MFPILSFALSISLGLATDGAHSVQPVEHGWTALNPGQSWRLDFDGRGFLVGPRDGQWTWGLQLEGYGYGGNMRVVSVPIGARASDARVTYEWDRNLSEWFINGSSGLEHGFTIRERPAPGTGGLAEALSLTLAVRGDWSPVIATNGRDVTFIGEGGRDAVDYSGLVVFDANGVVLDAGFHMAGEKLILTVKEQHAKYPITIDPVAQQLYIKASNTEANDQFGSAVSISGDTMVIGAVNEFSASMGVNGSQTSNAAPGAGAAYVFVRQGGFWVQQAYLKASNTDGGDRFGYSVSIFGDTIVVGALFEASGAGGIGADQLNNDAPGSGAAYVFVREAGTWTQQAYLKAENAGAGDQFGWTVAAYGDTIAVGAHQEEGGVGGIDGDPLDNSMVRAGAVYVFVRDGITWSQQAYIKSAQIDSEDQFGWSMALHEDTLVVGSNKEASAAQGVNGDDTDNSAPQAGAAYVFSRTGTNWAQTAYLKGSNTEQGDRFACELDYTGGLIVVGATYEDSNANTTNGDQTDNSIPSAGAAYVFEWDGVDWVQLAYLKAPVPDYRDHFGGTVAVQGETIVIGVYDEDSSATGIGGDMQNNLAQDSGAVYVFERLGLTWEMTEFVKASNTTPFSAFATSIDLQGSTLLVGAPGENSAATGFNGNQGDLSAPAAGAAFLFNLNGPSPQVPLCFGDGTGGTCPCASTGTLGAGCPNSSSGGARLTSGGQAFVTADSLTFVVQGSVPGALGLLLQGNATFPGNGIVVGNGLLCAQSQKRWDTVVADGTGSASYGPNLFGGHPHANAGATLFYQWWYRDVADTCGGGFNFSNGVAVTWQ